MYQKYLDKANQILEDEFGMGFGTLANRNNKIQEVVLSLIMLDLIEVLNKTQLNEPVEDSKKATKKNDKKE